KPLFPIDVTWTFVLSATILHSPDGSFQAPWLERQVVPSGTLRTEVATLARLETSPAPPSVDVAVSPQLVDQLAQMRRGFTLRTDGGTTHTPARRDGAAGADRVLRALRSIAASTSVELSAMPYADPNIPSLIRGGLGVDLP